MITTGLKYKSVICPSCCGEGRIFNQFFEQCRHEDYRNETVLKQGDCQHCENKDCKGIGEFIVCPLCSGDKILCKSEKTDNLYKLTCVYERSN